MTSNVQKLQLALKDTLDLIDERLDNISSPSSNNSALSKSTNPLLWAGPSSLLDRCTAVCLEHEAGENPKIRIVHHLAFTGGSIICRCLAGMPNVYLLSEAHPYADLHRGGNNLYNYLPTDIVSLAKYAGVPRHDLLASKLFSDSIETTYKHLSQFGGKLIIREHSHWDFCMGKNPTFVGAVQNILRERFDINSLLTIRDPIDSYSSIKVNSDQWIRTFGQVDFDEYCRRYNSFVDYYSEVEVIKYEEFVAQPEATLQEACRVLCIEYDDSFLDLMELFGMTGESGRFTADQVSPRTRRPLATEYVEEIKASENYWKFASKYNYESDNNYILSL